MRICRDARFRSVALPLIGAGTGGARPARVMEVMRAALAAGPYDGEVRIVRVGG